MPGTALAFSVLMAFLAPRYPVWFSGLLPPFTQAFLAIYPLWVAVSAIALMTVAVGEQISPLARRLAAWRALDVVLSVVSILIIAGGVIALFLPIFTRGELH
jgi:hypothetical protein